MNLFRSFLISIIFLSTSCATIQGKNTDKYPDKVDLIVDWQMWRQLKRQNPNTPVVFKPVEIYSDTDKNIELQSFVTDVCDSIKSNSNPGKSIGRRLYANYSKSKDKAQVRLINSRARSLYGDTILICAVKNKKPILVSYLMKIGVNKDISDYNDLTPIQIAKNTSHVLYVSLARDYKKDLSPEDTYSKYCKNGKQTRKLKESITVTLHKEKNLPLDQVALNLDKQKQIINQEMTTLYGRVRDHYLINDIHRDDIGCNGTNESTILYSCKIDPIYQKSKTKYSKYAIEMESWLDFKKLADHFAIKLSKSDQKRLFGDKKDPNYFYYKFSTNCDYTGGYLGFDKNSNGDCVFSPSKLLRKQELDRLYKNYAYKFTQVKKSPGRYPNELEFEVSLDLSLFCKNSIKIDDLLSR